jgi:LemA protein
MTGVMIGLVVGAIVLALLVVATYNNLVSLRQQVQEAWSAIDTELRRRYDLIPNLVETVKGYASHERETLEAVMRARNATVMQGPLEAQVASQNALSNALGRLMAVAEAYPQLQANSNFTQLQSELTETETRISQARRFYNANVKEYNTACEMFPSSLIASSFGFHPKPYYGIDNAAAFEPVAVNFSDARKEGTADGATLRIPEKQND